MIVIPWSLKESRISKLFAEYYQKGYLASVIYGRIWIYDSTGRLIKKLKMKRHWKVALRDCEKDLEIHRKTLKDAIDNMDARSNDYKSTIESYKFIVRKYKFMCKFAKHLSKRNLAYKKWFYIRGEQVYYLEVLAN